MVEYLIGRLVGQMVGFLGWLICWDKASGRGGGPIISSCSRVIR